MLLGFIGVLLALIFVVVYSIGFFISRTATRKTRSESNTVEEESPSPSPLLGVVLPRTLFWAEIVSEEEDRKEEEK